MASTAAEERALRRDGPGRRLRARLAREPTRRLLIGWAAATATAVCAFAVAKAASVASVAGSELGRRQLADDSAWAALGWLWSDVVAGAVVGGIIALLFGWPAGRRGRALATAGLVAAELVLAAAVLVGVELYALFGTVPTWQLLGALSDADNAADSVAELVSLGRVLLFAVLALVLALGTPLLRRLFERRPPLAARTGLAVVALAAVAGLFAAIAGPSRFDLHANPVLSFARTAVVGQTLEEVRASDVDFAEVLAPVADGAAVGESPDAAYAALSSWAGARKPNVVVVILETMAVRHMGLFGGPVANTPTFERLAGEGVLWTRHYAHAPSSMFSIYSILCSNHGEPHGPQITATRPRIDCRSLSELFGERGYRAGLFHSGRHSYSSKDLFFGGRGYEVVYDTQSMPGRERYRETSWGIEEAASIDALLSWVAKEPAAPFFVTYIPVYPHHPYPVPHARFDKFRGRGDVGRYRNAVYYIDQMVARLIEGLEEAGAAEDTLFLFVGDHGEGFGEHPGSTLHGSKLYDEAVHTFALWYAPGALSEPAVDARPMGHVDLAPTLLSLLGLEVPREHAGVSALAEGLRRMVPLYTGYGHPLVGFVDGRYKFIHDRRSGRSELYDLVADPRERQDVSGAHRGRVDTYERRAALFVAAQAAWQEALADLPTDPAMTEGTEAVWTADPSGCQFPAKYFEVAGERLHMRRAGEETVTCRHALPAAPGAVTGLEVRGAESYSGSFITAMLVWRRGEERRQVAYCTMNGSITEPADSCEARLAVGMTGIDGGGELSLELRYVTRERPPALERFRVDQVRVTYRVRE